MLVKPSFLSGAKVTNQLNLMPQPRSKAILKPTLFIMRSAIYQFLFLCCCISPAFVSAQDPGDAFFAAWTVHEIRFQFSQPGYLDSLTANYTLDQYMRSNVTIDGVAYPQSGVKYKGNSSYNNGSSKKPFRIDLSEYSDGQSHDGLKKLVLNNGFKDPTLLREKIMLDFLNDHGIAAPRCGFARLYVNNQYRGLYTVVEDVNKTFLEDRFGNKSGNLFKGDPKGTLVWKGASQSLYTTDFELKSNETANDWSDLIQFINVLNNTPNTQLPDSLAAYLNLNSWFDYWAAHNMFVNLDSYVGSGHNYFLYHNIDTDKFEWITWDVNEAFGNFQMGISLANLKVLPVGYIPMPANQRPMMSKLWTEQVFKQQFADRYCALLEDFTNAKMDPHIDSLADLIREAVYADPFKFFPNTQFEQNISQDLAGGGTPGVSTLAGLKPFITSRHISLVQQLITFGCSVSGTENPVENLPNIVLFPNPAKNDFYLQITGNEHITYSLTDISGRQISTGNGTGTILVPIEKLPGGIYLIQITDIISGRSICQKVIAE